MATGVRQVALMVLAAGLVQGCKAASLDAFTQCIGPQGQGPVCQLDAGVYQLSAPLTIGRSNITIEGTILNSLADTTLQRAPGSTRGLLASYQQGNPGISSITVRNFTFDGARDQQLAPLGSQEPDARFISVNSLLINDVAFVNSPNIALAIEGYLAQAATSGVVINNVSIDNAAYLGIWAYAYAGPSDTPEKYLTCGSLIYPSNIKITNSTFTNMGSNAIALEAAGVQIINNTLHHNHVTAPYDAPGGQIYVQICADDVAVLNNAVSDGPATANGFYSEGLELHGTNLAVVNNTISSNAGSGIQMSGVQNVFIANWSPGTGVIGNNLLPKSLQGGISVYNAAPGDVNQRQVDMITIDHAVSVNNQLSGIGIFLQAGQMTPISHVALTNNCLAGNLDGATYLFGLASDVLIANNLTSGCPK